MKANLNISVLGLILLATALLAACDREHMSDNYGKQSREFFARQHVHAKAAEGSPKGLDSEESSLIQASYRESLGGQTQNNTTAASSNVLMLQESPNGN